MGWQKKVLELVKTYGAPAKFAASTILSAVIPGSPAVIALVEKAFDTAEKTAQDDWELNLAKQLEATTENQVRLDQMLGILSSDLRQLFEQVVGLEKMPEIARQLVEESQKNDASFRESIEKLDAVAQRFDHLQEISEEILQANQTTHTKLEGIAASLDTLTFTALVQVSKDEWRGVCPTCRVERVFRWRYFDEQQHFGKKAIGFLMRDFLNPTNWVRAFTGVRSVANVGCEACKLPLVVCGNCRRAFSGDPNATLRQCPHCTTWNDG